MYLGRRSERVAFSIKTCECLFPVDRCHDGGVGAKNKSLFDIFLKSDLKRISPERPERFSFNEAFLHAWWVTLVEVRILKGFCWLVVYAPPGGGGYSREFWIGVCRDPTSGFAGFVNPNPI